MTSLEAARRFDQAVPFEGVKPQRAAAQLPSEQPSCRLEPVALEAVRASLKQAGLLEPLRRKPVQRARVKLAPRKPARGTYRGDAVGPLAGCKQAAYPQACPLRTTFALAPPRS
jgi:hypothetical protein